MPLPARLAGKTADNSRSSNPPQAGAGGEEGAGGGAEAAVPGRNDFFCVEPRPEPRVHVNNVQQLVLELGKGIPVGFGLDSVWICSW